MVIVSHQLERIASLCTHALLLDRGRVVRRGTPQECVSAYVTLGAGSGVRDGGHPVSLGPLRLMTPQPVPSGKSMTCLLDVRIRGDWPAEQLIGWRIRGLQNGQTLFAVNADRQRLAFPQHGALTLSFEFQANVTSGLYAVETVIWDPVSREEVLQGPQAVFQVADDPGFFGPVNMHSELSVIPPVEARDSALLLAGAGRHAAAAHARKP